MGENHLHFLSLILINLYIGKADWTWVEPHMGGKWSKTGQRQGEESPIRGTPLQASEIYTRMRVCAHTHPHTHTCL